MSQDLERVRMLVEHAPDAIAVHRNGRFVYTNPALVAALGYLDASELIGRSILDIVHPTDRARAMERMRAIYTTGTPNPPEEHRIIRKDGSVAIAELTGVIIDWGGEPAVVTFSRDVTERKRVQEQLLLADRLTALGTLCAGVAHEVNNPLGYVIVNLDLAAHELPRLASEASALECQLDSNLGARVAALASDLRALEERIATAREGTEQVRRIVADLRTLSRMDHDLRGPVDVRWVVDAAVKLAQHEIARRAQLVLELGEVPLVFANAPRLEQVFLNLLINAAQAIPVGRADDHQVRVRTATTRDGRVLVEVSDTGVGFPPELAGRIFDPFFTTKPEGEGTGLGLSICHGIIRDSGGEIEASAVPGQGATFRVLLPAMSLGESGAG
jgi:PAS domain S-box-containing protein